MEVPATSSAAATASEEPDIVYRDPDPTSENVLASSVAPPS